MNSFRQPNGAGESRAHGGLKVLLFTVLLAGGVAGAREQHTELKSDEQIVFFPTISQRVADKDAWRIEIRGCVFEPEKRRLMLAVLNESLELKNVELTAAEQGILDERSRLFLVDHERGKRICVRIGDKVFPLGKSQSDGNFEGKILLTEREIAALRQTDQGKDRRIRFAAELRPGDTRIFAGETILLNEIGLSVISDIDDTIKVTEVTDRSATVRNTFLRLFAPVPGMAAFYQNISRSNDAAFHYISASPWQLYLPLSEFVRSNGFPAGDFALKEFRWKDKTFLSLFADPEKYKPAVIEPLLKRFPKRRFVLIGDSGERDPEIYAALARKYPRQIERIFIRDVTGEARTAARYVKVFRELPPERWQIFTAPADLSASFEPARGKP